MPAWLAAAAAGPEAAQRGGGDGGRGAVAGAGQRVAQAPTIRPRTRAGIAEAHLGLGRMDVDVDLLGRQLDVERDQRMAVAGQEVGVGGAQRALQQPVAHRPAVDEQVLVGRRCRVEGRQAGIAGQPHALALRVDGERVVGEVAAQMAARRASRAVAARPSGRRPAA